MPTGPALLAAGGGEPDATVVSAGGALAEGAGSTTGAVDAAADGAGAPETGSDGAAVIVSCLPRVARTPTAIATTTTAAPPATTAGSGDRLGSPELRTVPNDALVCAIPDASDVERGVTGPLPSGRMSGRLAPLDLTTRAILSASTRASGAPNGARAMASAPASGKRWLGSFSRQRITTAPIPVLPMGSGAGGSVMMRAHTSGSVSASKGDAPPTIS